MIKRGFLFVFGTLFLLFINTPLCHAQSFSAPIPVGSDPGSQIGGIQPPATRVDATHLRFFTHPTPLPGSENFSTSGVEIGGRHYLIDDLVATPGLHPTDSPQNNLSQGEMLDYIGRRGTQTLDRLHGFCPEPYEGMGVVAQQGSRQLIPVVKTIDCKISNEAQTDHQLQIADIRPELISNEFFSLFGRDPLVDGLLGSGQQSLTPYAADLYPAMVRDGEPFTWPFIGGPNPGYNEVIAYDVADHPRGVITAVYDPLGLSLQLQESVEQQGLFGNPGTATIGPVPGLQLGVPYRVPFFSPVGFFRKDFDPLVGRMRLGGYSTTEFPFAASNPLHYFFPLAGAMLSSPLPSSQSFFVENRDELSLLPNFNPIAVESMDFTSLASATRLSRSVRSRQGHQSQRVTLLDWSQLKSPRGFAVVNQAPILGLDTEALFKGKPYIDPHDQLPHKWHEYLGFLDSDGNFQTLDSTVLPHRVVSYVVFWIEREEWGKDPVIESHNPNSVFEPFAYAFVGPGMFDAAAITDTRPLRRHSLVVPSGEPAADGKYYLYKIDPIFSHKGRTIQPKLPKLFGETFVHLSSSGGSTPPIRSPRPVEVKGLVIPEVYEIEVPEGFAPYAIRTADIDQDGCGDVMLTFRGAETVLLDPSQTFTNEPGQHVLFQEEGCPTQPCRMFSNQAVLYRGEWLGNHCGISKQGIPYFPRPDAQVAALEIGDFDGNGSLDLMLGDLELREIEPPFPDAGLSTGHAYLYSPMTLAPLIAPQKIRFGFTSTASEKGIIDVMKGADGLIGVSALTVDQQPSQGDNAAAILGAPLTLPRFGCPFPGVNTATVDSPPGLYLSALNGLIDPATGLLSSPWCQKRTICTISGTSPPLHLPFWNQSGSLSADPCCNPCDPDGQLGTGDEWPTNRCQQIICAVQAGQRLYPDQCDHFNRQCPGGAGSGPFQQAPGTGNPNIQINLPPTPPFQTSRRDVIYDSQASFRGIARVEELLPAQSGGGGIVSPQFPLNAPQQPPPMNVQLPPLPRGQIMPGPREMTSIVNLGRSQQRGCEVNAPIDPAAGIECSQLDETPCTSQGMFCGIDCKCHSYCKPTDECGPGSGSGLGKACATGKICDAFTCSCIDPDQLPPEPKPEPSESVAGDCTCKVEGFSSTSVKEKIYDPLNEQFRAITGKRGDIIGQQEFSVVTCGCCFADASAQGLSASDVPLSLGMTPLPSIDGNLLPWMVVQERGPILADFTKSKWLPQNITVVEEPLRLFPQLNTSTDNSLTLPSISSSSVFANVNAMGALYEVSHEQPNNMTSRLNNVIQHQVHVASSGEILSVTPGLSISVPHRSTAPSGPGVGGAPGGALDDFIIGIASPTTGVCHVFAARLQPDIASWTGVAGAPQQVLKIEERQFDWKAVKAKLQERREAKELVGKRFTSKDLSNLPWEENMTYELTIVQSTYAGGEPQEAKVVFLGGYPFVGGRGAGCSCDLSGERGDLKQLTLLTLLFLLMLVPLVIKRFNFPLHRHKGRSHEPLLK